MDWDKLGEEAVAYLRDYLRIDTSNPPGNEAPGAEFLGAILAQEDVDFTIYESEPGRSSLLARLEGKGEEKPLILLNHIDVVPADPEAWDIHPFAGEIRDGFIWGRGALDMKGMAIMELASFLAARREGLELKRDVVFLAVADEEAGGDHGIRYMLDNHSRELEAGLVINEGGFATTDLVAGLPLFMIASGEKYGLWLRLRRRGMGGHGSMPTGQGALELLVSALARLLAVQRPLNINPIMRSFFATLSEYWEMLKPYKDDGRTETLRKLIEDFNLSSIPALGALLRDTVSLNILNAGTKINVIPDQAEASLDCRLLPETDAEEFLGYLRDALRDPEIEIDTVLEMENAPPSPMDGEIFRTLKKVVSENYPGAVVSPFLLSGLSDSRFFRDRGVPCYGIIPARLGMADLSSIHGVNEKIAVEDMKKGVEFIFDLIVALCD